MPKISVIMPAYNGGRYIAEAIESILNQTCQDFELIIVNDGSTDGTADIVNQYIDHPKVTIVHHSSNLGVSAAKNSGIADSQGKYLVFAAADDIQEPERLEAPLLLLEEDPTLDMVFIDCIMVDEQNRPLNRRKGYPEGMTSENAILYQLKRNHLWSGLVMLRKTSDIWFDTSIPNAVDYELFLRLLLADYKLAIIDRPLMRYRIHNENISGNRKISGKSVEKILHGLDFQQILIDLTKKFSPEEVRLAIAGAVLAANESDVAVEYLKEIDFESGVSAVEKEFTLGVCYYKQGQYQKSLEHFQATERMVPDDPAVLNNLGVIITLTKGSRDESEKLIRRALELREGYLDADNNLKSLTVGDNFNLRITERQLRASFIHAEHYKL